jgi:shikimate kinase
VLDKNNVSALRRNGKIVFLNRSVQNLVATKSRPLSSNAKDLKNMFEQRYPIYKASADIEINNDETVDIAVREIAKEFEK